MDSAVGVDEDALGSEPLGAVAGDSVAMVEVAISAICEKQGHRNETTTIHRESN